MNQAANASASTAQEKEQLPRWDLTEYYDNIRDPQIKADLDQAEDMATAFAEKYKGKVASLSGDELAQALREEDAFSSLALKSQYYAFLLKAQDQTNTEVSAFDQSVSECGTAIGQHAQFFGLELKKIDDTALAQKFAESEDLQQYKPLIENVRRYRDHTLPDEQEALLMKLSPVKATSQLNRLLEESRARMRFDFRGEELTEVELEKHLDSADEQTRKEALQARSKGFSDNIHLPAFVMNTLIREKQITDELRGYEGDMGNRNLSNNLEAEVVDTLLDTVIANYEDTSQRFNRIKAELLGKDTLAEWDLRAPLPEKSDEYIPWEKAKDIVLSAYRDFSPEMADIAQKFFDEGWIDAEPRPGKRGGAFSMGGLAEHHPHVHMSYMGKPRDVMTLAHELGHGVHQYLEKQTHGNIAPGTPLSLAETASIFGEELVFNKLLAEIENPTERKVLLTEKVADGIGTIVRQASWVDFERRIHADRREGELSPEDFAKHWQDVNESREGAAVAEYSEGSENGWARVPHMFRTPFYMYAYSFGNLMVNSLFQAHEEGRVENFPEKYVEMLSAGGTQHHSELLEPFGLNAADPQFWQQGLDVLKTRLDQLEAVIAEEKEYKNAKGTGQNVTDAPVRVASVEVVGKDRDTAAKQAQGRG